MSNKTRKSEQNLELSMGQKLKAKLSGPPENIGIGCLGITAIVGGFAGSAVVVLVPTLGIVGIIGLMRAF